MNNSAVQLIRNATLKIRYSGQTILVDPVLAKKGTLRSALGINKNPRVHLLYPVEEVVKDVNMILLTHNHIDHYEPSVKEHIAADTLFLVQPQDKEAIEKDGFTNVSVVDNKTTVGNVTIYRISGHHGFGKLGEMMGAVSGYILKAEGCPTIYIIGDCRWESSIHEAVKNFAPDYIVINSGGAGFPELSKDLGPVLSDETEAIRIIKECPSSTRFIAVHMDAIDHCQTTRSILRNEAQYNCIDMSRLLIPEDGEIITL